MGTEAFGDAPVADLVQPCPLAPMHWLEIELLDDAGRPVAHEPYRVTLPGGQVVAGFLDANGRERLDSIPDAGECQVSFPQLDDAAWEVDFPVL